MSRPAPHTVLLGRSLVLAAPLAALVALSACGSSSPSSGSAATTAPTTIARPTGSPTAVLLQSLQTLSSDTASLSATLTRLRSANNFGGSVSGTSVSSAVYPVMSLLTTLNAELRALVPTLPSSAMAHGQAIQAGVSQALASFTNTSRADITASGGSGGLGLKGAAQNLLNQAIGGSLVASYQSDAQLVTTMEHTSEPPFVADLEARATSS